MSRHSLTLLGALSMLALFAAANVLAYIHLGAAVRDVTRERLYQLSEPALEAAANVAEPVKLTFYYSRLEGFSVPEVRHYAERVSAVLRAFERASGGRIRVEEVDTALEPVAADEAKAAGLSDAPLPGRKAPFLMGLVGRNSVDDVLSLPRLDHKAPGLLEYDIARMLIHLEHAERPRIGLLDAEVLRGPVAMRAMLADLESRFDIERLSAAELRERAARFDALLIVQPDPMSRDEQYDLDQALMRVGRAVILADPASHIDNASSFELTPLMSRWGMVLLNEAAFDPLQRGAVEGAAAPSALHLRAPERQMNAADLAAARFSSGLRLASAGSLAPVTGSALDFSPLVSGLEDYQSIDLLPASKLTSQAALARWAKDLPDERMAHIFGARADGAIPSGFPERAGPGHLAASDAGGVLYVIADTDFVDAALSSGDEPVDNAIVLAALADAAAAPQSLRGFVARAKRESPLFVLQQMRHEAEQADIEDKQRLRDQLAAAEDELAELLASHRSGLMVGVGALYDGADASAERLMLADKSVDIRQRLRKLEDRSRRSLDRTVAWVIVLNTCVAAFLFACAGIVAGLIRRSRLKSIRMRG